MQIGMRYVTFRTNADGSRRYYWQRPGWPLTRLPDDEVTRFKEQKRLNEQADKAGPQKKAKPKKALARAAAKGSVGWLVLEYRSNEVFTARARNTRLAYEVFLRQIEFHWRHSRIKGLTRVVCNEFIEDIPTLGMRRLARAVFRNLFKLAMNKGYLTINPLDGYTLPVPESRDRFATEEELQAIRRACQSHRYGEGMLTALALLLYTGQRVMDVLTMSWKHHEGDVIAVAQEKTRKRLRIACHKDLQARLVSLKEDRKGVMIVNRDDGRAFYYELFNQTWREICAAAGVSDLQARDLRRTAVIRLAESGCTEAEIKSITGHSADQIKILLETYLVPTEEMSRNAIAKLEAHQERKSNVERVRQNESGV